MGLVQLILKAVLPAATVERMKAQTNQWRIRCTNCGHSKGLWEAGGVRYKKAAVGTASATLIRCNQCGGIRPGVVERVPRNA